MEVESAAAAQGLALEVAVEVEGIRLIADLVAAGEYASILPETALPPDPVISAPLPSRRCLRAASRS